MCCHTETRVEDQTFHLTQWQYTDTTPTCPNADPKTQGAWQASHWSAKFLSQLYDSARKNPVKGGTQTKNKKTQNRQRTETLDSWDSN